jgi:hypothetical protein
MKKDLKKGQAQQKRNIGARVLLDGLNPKDLNLTQRTWGHQKPIVLRFVR